MPAKRLVAAVVVVAVMTVFVVARVIRSAQSLDIALMRHHQFEIGLIVGTSVLAVLALGASWMTLLRGADPIVEPQRLRLLTFFSLTWLGRYVPGTLPFLSARIYVATRAGYGTRASAISTGSQAVLEVLVAAGFGGVALVFAREGFEAPLAWVAASLLLALCAVGLHPKTFGSITVAASRLRGRSEQKIMAHPASKMIAVSVACCLGCQVLVTAGVLLTASLITDVQTGDSAAFAAAASLSGIAGVLVVVAPAGLGVRDAALAALLAGVMPAETAVSIAIAYRAITVLSDVLLAGVALITTRLVTWMGDRISSRAQSSLLEQNA